MRILHIENLGGNPYRLSRAQRALGHHADVLETVSLAGRFPHDLENYYDRERRSPLSTLRKMVRTYRLAKGYDVVHMHGGIHRKRIDIPLISRIGRRPLVVHYRGDETRYGYGMHYLGSVDARIVSTPDLLKWHRDAVFIPNPIDLREVSWPDGPRPVVAHMPSDRARKGTGLILQAIEELRRRGAEFEFLLIENVSHEEAMRRLAQAHVLVDQVVATGKPDEVDGLFGTAALEAMAMGKVAVAYVKEEHLRHYPGCPVVSPAPTAAGVAEALADLMSDMDRARGIGERGRAYVASAHDPGAIVARVMEVYQGVAK
jgi:glycosyltransferase involved in cell wall biosynthesis